MSYQMMLPGIEISNLWRIVPDGYPPAAQLFARHYSYHHYKDDRRTNLNYRNRNLIIGPGEKMVLMTEKNNALFGWRKFISDDGQRGVNCSVFRNELEYLSSHLIVEAMKLATMRWPGERLYTYVDPTAIKSVNPGACFKKAGWRKCGITKVKKLLIFEVSA